MKDIIVKIMAEVLSILGIVTKEINQGRTSTSFIVNISPKIDLSAVAFLKQLIGRKDVEEALQRLDQLTQEEARMAAAETLRIVRSTDDMVKVVRGEVTDVGDKVKDVDDKVKVVYNKVKDVDENVKDVCGKVEGVGKGVQDVGIKVGDIDNQVRVLDSKLRNVDHKIGSVIQGALCLP
jgi:methyl-accepting chemotaxis protein